MKQTFKLLGLALLAIAITVAASGCGALGTLNSNTPHTTIKGQICGQPFSIENPKDTILDGLEVAAGTNGQASIKIQHLTTVMNPANTTATGEAQVKSIAAGADAFERGMNAAANAAGTLSGAAAKTAK